MAKKLGGLGKGLNAIFIENESEDKNSTVALDISEIEPNKGQPRHDFDEKALSELADSISAHGVLQPLLVRPLIGGGYQIVAGERRFRACLMAGVTKVPVVIRELTDSETMELALIENLQRENLSSVEEAQGYKTLMSQYGMTQEQVATAVGKSRPSVANALRLLTLPQEIIEMISDGRLSAGHAKALVSVEDPDKALSIAGEIVKKGLSVRQAEKLASAEKKKKPATAKTTAPSYFKEVELALTEYMGKRVTVQPAKKGDGGVLSIEFYSQQELAEIANKLEEQ